MVILLWTYAWIRSHELLSQKCLTLSAFPFFERLRLQAIDATMTSRYCSGKKYFGTRCLAPPPQKKKTPNIYAKWNLKNKGLDYLWSLNCHKTKEPKLPKLFLSFLFIYSRPPYFNIDFFYLYFSFFLSLFIFFKFLHSFQFSLNFLFFFFVYLNKITFIKYWMTIKILFLSRL